MSKPTSRDGEKSLGQQHHKNKSIGGSPHNRDVTTHRRIIFPSLHPQSGQAVRYYGSSQAAKEIDAGPEMERSLSFPKNGLRGDIQQTIDRKQMLPLPKLPELKPNPSSSLNPKPGRRIIRDSICVRKAILPKVPLDEHQSTPLSNKKWVVQSPQIDSLSLETQPSQIGSRRTYYPAASIPKYHEPPTKAIANTEQHLQSILRTSSSETLGGKPKRRSSILFRSPTMPLSPDDVNLSPNENLSSSLTLASPTSIRSLASDLDHHGETHHDSIGETESDLKRITVPPQKVIPRQDPKLRRNASDTVVVKSEEEVHQRRKKSSAHTEDKKLSMDDGAVTRHESLECLPSHKQISFDPHIWVYEFTDDRHEFENGGKWFTEDELDQFKEDAIQRIRQRNMMMMSAGQGRIIAMVPPRDRSQTPSPLTTPPDNTRPVVFTHPALGLEDEFDSDASFRSTKKSRETLIYDALSREMRNVLVVDPHDVFLTLFTKCFKYIIPHVSVATARSGEEALSR